MYFIGHLTLSTNILVCSVDAHCFLPWWPLNIINEQSCSLIPFCEDGVTSVRIDTQTSILPIPNMPVLGSILISKDRQIDLHLSWINMYFFISYYVIYSTFSPRVGRTTSSTSTCNANYGCINVLVCAPPTCAHTHATPQR